MGGIDFNPSWMPLAQFFSYLPRHEECTTTQTLTISFCNALKAHIWPTSYSYGCLRCKRALSLFNKRLDLYQNIFKISQIFEDDKPSKYIEIWVFAVSTGKLSGSSVDRKHLSLFQPFYGSSNDSISEYWVQS